MPLDSPNLEMKSIRLQPFSMADVDQQYFDWLHDDEVVRFLSVARQDRSMETLGAYVAATRDNPNHHFFKIVAKAEGVKVGTISLHIDVGQNIADFGYLIGDRNFWGGDTAIEAQVALFDFAFQDLGLRKLHGGAAIANVGSNFNYNRLGFKREGLRRGHLVVGSDEDPTVMDMVEWGCLAEEWNTFGRKFDSFRMEETRDEL